LTVAEIQDLKQDLLEKAFAAIRRESKFFPKPGDIRDIVHRDPFAAMKFFNEGK
jgi:hypothetical protein